MDKPISDGRSFIIGAILGLAALGVIFGLLTN